MAIKKIEIKKIAIRATHIVLVLILVLKKKSPAFRAELLVFILIQLDKLASPLYGLP